MALTRATTIVKAALKREATLMNKEFDPSRIPYNYSINNNEGYAKKILKEYANAGMIDKSNLSNCISIVEGFEENGYNAKSLALYIANEIVPNAITETANLNNVSEISRNIIQEAIDKNMFYDRLTQNQATLEKRFNISNTCKGNNIKKICESLCSLIDTYNTPLVIKYNVALENVMFSLVKNNVVFESDMEIANYVTEYFMLRDPIIYDSTYKKYQKLLKESKMYNISEATGIVAALLNNDGNYFGNKVSKILSESNDDSIKEFATLFESVVSESDVSEYINNVSDFIDHNQVTTLDRNRIYYSVDMLSNHSGVDPSFIHMTIGNVFGDIDIKPTIDVDFPDKSRDVFASIPSVDNIISETNACQVKDYDCLLNLCNIIDGKPNAAIFSKLPEIFTCMKTNLTLHGFPCKPTCDRCLQTIKRFYAATTSFAQVEELNRNIKAILLVPSLSINDDLINFQHELEKLIELNSDTSALEETDIFKCFKSEEEVLEAFTNLCLVAEDTMKKSINRDALQYTVEVCAQRGWMSPLVEAYEYLNAPIGVIESAYEKVYDSTTMRTFEDIYNPDNYTIKKYSIESLIATIEATQLFESLDESFTLIEEAGTNSKNSSSSVGDKIDNAIKKGTNFITTLKLGLANLKKKAQKLDTKQQEMWRTLDAYANKFARSLSDDDEKRRAQLLQGQAIPSFSKCFKTGLGLIAAGVATGNILVPMIGALGIMGNNKFLNDKQRKQLIGELEIELKVVEKQLDMAEKDDDLTQYRQLLMVQRKIQHEIQRLRFKRKPFKLGGRK